MATARPAIQEEAVDRTLALARETLAFGYGDLSDADHTQLGRLILDHLACVYRGSSLSWSRALADWAAPYDGSGRAAIIGGGRHVAPPIAALVNATAAHGLELDDTHDESVSHPGAVVIGAALAVAQQRGLGGKALLPAIAAGYEVIGRVGAATGAASIIEDGFHPTALFGSFGAAAATAHLMTLDAETLNRAFGLALSMAGGSMQFAEDALATSVKRLHGGYSAHHGVLAAELASAGLAGPTRAFDGRYGLCNLYGGAPKLDRLSRAPGAPLEIHRISFKPYPCCRLFHSTIDALEQATDGFKLDPARIRRIKVGGPSIMAMQHMQRRPRSVMAAQYSLPHTLAAALLHGPRAVEGFTEAAMANVRLHALADLVEAETDSEMEAAFPSHFGSTLMLEGEGGMTRCIKVLDSLGTPARPMTRDALIAKFDELVAPTGLALGGAFVAGRLDRLGGAILLDDLLAPFLKTPQPT
ncbi:MAG: MmgE/PrpD family protein [Alphaproteobacteria bacterium]|nr:MmgE/PrpD family protein [Alphaproteobacteria bacterium]